MTRYEKLQKDKKYWQMELFDSRIGSERCEEALKHLDEIEEILSQYHVGDALRDIKVVVS